MSKKRGNGEGTIYYSESLNCWVAQYSIKGKRKSIYGKTKKEVTEKKIQALSTIQNGTYIDKSTVELIQLLKDIENAKLSANLIKESSYARNLETIKVIEKSNLNGLKVQEITSKELQDFLNTKIESSQSTIDKFWQTLNGGFKKAIAEDIILKNPMDKVLRPVAKKGRKKVVALTVFEQNKLLEFLRNNDIGETYSNIILLSLFTGMRVGEICALKFSDIDFAEKKIIVQRTLTKTADYSLILGDSTKTGKRKIDGVGKREIPFQVYSGSLLECLLKKQIHTASSYVRNKDKLLFCNLDGSYISASKMNNIFKSICKIIGMNKNQVNFHMLRHTFATRCIESGMPPVVLSKLLGHSKIETTLNVYVDVFEKYRNDNLDDLNNYYQKNNIKYDFA